MGNDRPSLAYAALWTLIGAKLFARKDGTSPLIGFNWSNSDSASNKTMEITAQVRKALGFGEVVRFEHHIVETYKSIAPGSGGQPLSANRRDEVVEVAARVANISAKHAGCDPEIDQTREQSSDILDYFRDKAEIEAAGDMPRAERVPCVPYLLRNYLDWHDAVNATARALTEHGLSFVAARKLHHLP